MASNTRRTTPRISVSEESDLRNRIDTLENYLTEIAASHRVQQQEIQYLRKIQEDVSQSLALLAETRVGLNSQSEKINVLFTKYDGMRETVEQLNTQFQVHRQVDSTRLGAANWILRNLMPIAAIVAALAAMGGIKIA